MLREWIITDQVGIGTDVNTTKNRIISVLIEKDFVCIDAHEEDNIGTYQNPLIVCQA